MEFTEFKQLEHDYIGYQSLTDVPQTLSYPDYDGSTNIQVGKIEKQTWKWQKTKTNSAILGLDSTRPDWSLPRQSRPATTFSITRSASAPPRPQLWNKWVQHRGTHSISLQSSWFKTLLGRSQTLQLVTQAHCRFNFAVYNCSTGQRKTGYSFLAILRNKSNSGVVVDCGRDWPWRDGIWSTDDSGGNSICDVHTRSTA